MSKDQKFYSCRNSTSRRGDGKADLKYVFEVCKNLIGELNKKDKSIIVTKSTVPIGTGKKIKRLFENIVLHSPMVRL